MKLLTLSTLPAQRYIYQRAGILVSKLWQSFVFRSICTTFHPGEDTFVRKRKEKKYFILYCARLFVPLQQISKKYDERTHLYQF